MIHAPAISRFTAASTGAISGQRAAGAANLLDRDEWVSSCATRLSQLRRDDDPEFLVSVAAGLWADVASFDPVIAAEMEHEAWPWDH